ncbi:MAG: OmpA family protein, partial [Acidobacteria bacterium]|nr:OmpA family protein [Acidobacteriota bacterium]
AEPRSQDVLEEGVHLDSAQGDNAEMAELRTLLLGPAEGQIAEIHDRLTDPHRQLTEVSSVLPDAIAVRTRQDDELSHALGPTITTAIERSVRKNPQPLVDAIFPVIGPAIRRAISVALGGMVQSLNQSMAYSFSAQGLKWRIEGWRTGKPFAEVVLLHTLLYRVEQVFLIHRETGLLLQHVVAGSGSVQDADMVSGMLTAIQDFVHDSFNSPQEEQLETLEVGELTVWIEQGPLAILAAVIRGTAPQELRPVFQETLETIHLQFRPALQEFSGDASEFDATRPLLEDCLQTQLDEEKRSQAPKARIPIPILVIASLIVIGLLVWGFLAWRDARRWDAYLERVKREPGVVVTDEGKRDGKYFIAGLRDPLAQDPRAFLAEANVDPEDVVTRFEPFQAMSPEFVLARARRLLEPPQTVNLKFADGTLEAEGFASLQWIMELRRTVRFIPGVNQLKEDKLLDVDRIVNPSLLFMVDRTELAPGQEEKFRQLTADIERLQTLAEGMKKSVRLEITGRADGSGTEERNAELSRGRSETIASELNARLPSKTNLTIVPVASKEKLREEVTEADRAANRSVTFKIILTDAR